MEHTSLIFEGGNPIVSIGATSNGESHYETVDFTITAKSTNPAIKITSGGVLSDLDGTLFIERKSKSNFQGTEKIGGLYKFRSSNSYWIKAAFEDREFDGVVQAVLAGQTPEQISVDIEGLSSREPAAAYGEYIYTWDTKEEVSSELNLVRINYRFYPAREPPRFSMESFANKVLSRLMVAISLLLLIMVVMIFK